MKPTAKIALFLGVPTIVVISNSSIVIWGNIYKVFRRYQG
ncbi:hypothetical protein HJ01_01422 [Flavobacterium frigoris PS1]|uniref:Uncharacterized protein n=1 Tax=Flavobacterium frigoris (strain PS1) TaxID=1086011 RepID=H7FQG2_FLAFP|nr:hypothetical protein HJ01_01422 [Flavobacterium frigoris PS1]